MRCCQVVAVAWCVLGAGLAAIAGEGNAGASWDIDWVKSKEGWQEYGLDNLCGVRAVRVILRDLGRESDEQSIAGAMPPGVYGNSMEQIVGFLRSQGLEAEAMRCKASQLQASLAGAGRRWAVINLYGHWTVARRVVEGNSLEIIDYPRKYCMPVDAVDRLWEGHAIIASEPRFWHGWAVRAMAVSVMGMAVVIMAVVARARGKAAMGKTIVLGS